MAKSKEKWFAFHWKDGSTTYSKGKDVAEAAHIGVGGLAALDYWEEVKELPNEHKEVRYISKDGENNILHPNTMFVKQVLPQLLSGAKMVSTTICNRTYNCKVEKTALEYVLTQV